MNKHNALQQEFLRELERSAPEETYQTYSCLIESLTQYQTENDIEIADTLFHSGLLVSWSSNTNQKEVPL